jgi:DNA-binding beta-propeller fold protein YncE
VTWVFTVALLNPSVWLSAMRRGHTASVIDLRTGKIVDTLSTLQGPDGIAYDSNTGTVYISNEDPGRVSVISLPPSDR